MSPECGAKDGSGERTEGGDRLELSQTGNREGEKAKERVREEWKGRRDRWGEGDRGKGEKEWEGGNGEGIRWRAERGERKLSGRS